MRFHVRKTERILGSLLIVAASGIGLLAQDQSGAPSAASSAAAAPSSAAVQATASQAANGIQSTDATGAGQTTSSALDYLFNHKPQEGSVAKEAVDANTEAKARAAAADAVGNRMQDSQVRARFDTYLGMDAVPPDQLKAYAATFDQIGQLLRDGKIFEAWRQLHDLSQYEVIDAGVSGQLADRVESIWTTNKATQQIAQQNQKLQDNADTASRSADMMSDDIQDKEIEYQRRLAYAQGKKSNTPPDTGNGGQNPTQPNISGQDSGAASPNVDNVMGKLQLTDQYLQSLEDQSKIKLNELKAEKMMDQAKSDFADYITTLYQSGCYRHVLIAADFYRYVFDEGEYPSSMAKQVNDSLQITRNAGDSVSVFNNAMADGQIATATDRLQEAFLTSEFDPSLLGIDLGKKKNVAAFMKNLDKMQNLIEARDFSNLEALLDQMKAAAPDFDNTKAMAIINEVKLASQLHLGKAKLAAQQGDQKTALEEFQSAAEIWPGNPALHDNALSFFNSSDVQTQALTEFDRLVADNNYRAIYDKQLMFAPAMKDDTKRQQQLKDALGKVQEAETAVQKANMLATNGDVSGAWETVNLAVKDLPDDLKLNAMLGQLAGKSAEFVSAINKAKDAEGRSEFGYSLTWYAIAQRDYPASIIANDGVSRLSKQILANQL